MPLKLKDIPPFPDTVEGETDHEFLYRARENGPLAIDKFGIVTAFSLDHLLAFNDDRWTRQIELEGMRASGVSSGAMYDFVSNVMLFANGRTHRDRRAPAAATFARPALAALRPEVRARADALIAPLVGQGSIDFLDCVASPLPARIIASLIGAPEEDSDWFGKRVYSAIRGLSLCTDEVRAESDADAALLRDYVQTLLDMRQEHPQDDFLTAYLARVTGGPLDTDEIRAQIMGLVLAGSDTTRGALASTVSQLLQHPEQWQMLVDDPETHAAPAVSEGLRFDPVIASLGRLTTEPREVEGVMLPAYTFVAGSMLTALRDPAVYDSPDRFDITRGDHPRYHPVFGGGPHRCLGEALARIELEEALKALATHAPHMALDGPPVRLKGRGATRQLGPMRVTL
ncbi:cytochrome P450 [Lutimaribacter marinistellae]|uniref:Cytochrome P450 n=1 Tax=Lutimaribacter marinistellae TaxID=1820329 RepID=A0ABV7TA95_9RHOB